jgi:hypothetical protein
MRSAVSTVRRNRSRSVRDCRTKVAATGPLAAGMAASDGSGGSASPTYSASATRMLVAVVLSVSGMSDAHDVRGSVPARTWLLSAKATSLCVACLS